MSSKITPLDVLPCVYRFLLKYGFTDAAENIEENADITAVRTLKPPFYPIYEYSPKKLILKPYPICSRKEAFQAENS